MAGELVPRPEVGSLEHYGVKGMKWGQRNASKNPVPVLLRPQVKVGMKIGEAINRRRFTPDSSGVNRSQARQQIKAQNRQTSRNLQDFDAPSNPNRSKMIRAARANRVAAQRKYEDVKTDIKNQKSTGALGRNAARVAMNKAKNERYENVFKADSKTMGEQFIQALFEPRVTVTSSRW